MVHDASERHCLLRAHSPISIWLEAACKEDAKTQADQPSDGRGDGEAASAGGAAACKATVTPVVPTIGSSANLVGVVLLLLQEGA